MRDPVVLEGALSRFGCCPAEHVPTLTRQRLARGRATTPAGHAIRIGAFGDFPDRARQGSWITVPMRHVVLFLRGYLREHWAVLRHAQIRPQGVAEVRGLPDVTRPGRPLRGCPRVTCRNMAELGVTPMRRVLALLLSFVIFGTTTEGGVLCMSFMRPAADTHHCGRGAGPTVSAAPAGSCCAVSGQAQTQGPVVPRAGAPPFSRAPEVLAAWLYADERTGHTPHLRPPPQRNAHVVPIYLEQLALLI